MWLILIFWMENCCWIWTVMMFTEWNHQFCTAYIIIQLKREAIRSHSATLVMLMAFIRVMKNLNSFLWSNCQLNHLCMSCIECCSMYMHNSWVAELMTEIAGVIWCQTLCWSDMKAWIKAWTLWYFTKIWVAANQEQKENKYHVSIQQHY